MARIAEPSVKTLTLEHLLSSPWRAVPSMQSFNFPCASDISIRIY
jgi:hypothetical protein